MFVDHCLSFCHFSFRYFVVCPSIYTFWLPLWYLQTLFENAAISKLDHLCLSDMNLRICYHILNWSPPVKFVIMNFIIWILWLHFHNILSCDIKLFSSLVILFEKCVNWPSPLFKMAAMADIYIYREWMWSSGLGHWT